jgi:protein-tyrosine phosphatase
MPRGVAPTWHAWSTRLWKPDPPPTPLTWIGEERLAIGSIPTGASVGLLAGEGVTHVVNCRARPQTWLSKDLAVERLLFGASRVVHAPMWDSGRPQPPERWSAAARFAVDALDADPEHRVLIHCHAGRRRSVLVAYAVLRLRGHAAEEAARLILSHRVEAQLVPAYRDSVERWLDSVE